MATTQNVQHLDSAAASGANILAAQKPLIRMSLGRHVYGLAAVAFAVLALVWRDFNGWEQIRVLGNVSHRGILLLIAASLQFCGGLLIQSRKTARAGALALGAIYFVFVLLWVPFIVATPATYDPWANFFEQFSLVSGALLVYASRDQSNSQPAARVARIAYWCFGLCVISFMLEQLFYLSATASFVPKWIPLGQMFWAVVTTAAFPLAAIALFSGRLALLASRLLTVMLIGFGLLVWLPIAFADPHRLFNWAGNVENWAITGAAWIVADFLAQRRSG